MRYLTGFRLLSQLKGSGLKYYKASDDNISKGDALFQNANGYAVNDQTAFKKGFLGIAAEDCDNSGGSEGDKEVAVIPPLQEYKFMVQNESGTQIAQADVGEIVDLDSANGIDVTDETCIYWGFQVDEIDTSTEALAADGVASTGGGFAIGHFVPTADES